MKIELQLPRKQLSSVWTTR